MSAQAKKRIQELIGIIRRHNHAYYALSQPRVSDNEYDLLLAELRSLEEKYPQYLRADSPTQKVGGRAAEGFKTLAHIQKMLSLDNTYSIDELKDWDARVHKGLSGASLSGYVAELKIDGVSVNLHYESGRLLRALTRGDGQVGEDVTRNALTISAIPRVLSGRDIPGLIEIRGEVFMDKEEFAVLNKTKDDSGLALFANPRNAASGSLKLLDSSIVARRKLSFFAHSLGAYNGYRPSGQWEFLSHLKHWGLQVNPHSCFCREIEEVIAYCAKWQDRRGSLSYDIDGIVVKLNALSQQASLGFTLKSPRWAVAYKFPGRQATTRVIRIKVNVGRTGVITPTAELAPVECSGVIISSATLHNFDEIKRLDIRESDRVLIERAGDVIPKVVKVVEHGGRKPYTIPGECPACSGKIVKEQIDNVGYYCINPDCPAQLKRALLHFASRKALDIQGLGESTIDCLVDRGFIKSLADIYRLRLEDLLKIELFKDKKANNLLAAIEKSKQRPLASLIYALGIRHVGEKAALTLAQGFGSIDKLMRADFEDLVGIHEIGPVMADSLADYFNSSQVKKILQALRRSGLNFIAAKNRLKSAALAGLTAVFTGELKNYPRLAAEGLWRQSGGKTSSSVSRKTDFLVAGENPGSKFGQAVKLGVKIIKEQEFEGMVK